MVYGLTAGRVESGYGDVSRENSSDLTLSLVADQKELFHKKEKCTEGVFDEQSSRTDIRGAHAKHNLQFDPPVDAAYNIRRQCGPSAHSHCLTDGQPCMTADAVALQVAVTLRLRS